MRRHRPRISNFWAGTMAVIVVAAACYLVFGGSIPFSGSPFVLRAMFTAETQLHLDSPVRIAGVNVGTVTSVQRVAGSSNAALVKMAINSNGLPLHSNATINVRPRLFLEGNFYVDLQPGTPSAPVLNSGSTLPAANTSGPVQLDRVLSALDSNTRANLEVLVQGLGSSLNVEPSGSEDATADPTQRGLTAGQSLNQSLNYAPQAFKTATLVNEALLGTQPNDLAGVITGTDHFFGALSSAQRQLAHLVGVFNTTVGALANRQQDLSRTIALLPPLLRSTNNALGPLQASFEPTRQFANDLLPAVKQLAPTITAGLPWITQSIDLFSPQELRGLLTDLTPAVQNTASSLKSTETLLTQSEDLARCFTHNVIPVGNQRIQDPPLTTGLQLYQELFQSGVGIASVSQNFDGNGRYVRASTGGGSARVATGALGSSGPTYGNAVLPSLGTRPANPGKVPPIQSNIACFKNAVSNLNSAKEGAGP